MRDTSAPPVVQVAGGSLSGVWRGEIATFLGAPYAAAPVGERRFALPQPPEPWEGVREATQLGPNAPQWMRDFPAMDMEPLVGRGWEKGDDYLNANIWAPANAEAAPVMVFVHGGAFIAGSNRASTYDGATFARDGVVCLSVNYRMGVEGFLPIPGAPTNLGLHDLIQALRWVRENSAAFGGDPENVTVFGESAGAMLIATLMGSPLAKGLFKRAIVQSGHASLVRPIPLVQEVVRKVASLMGVMADVGGFRSKSVDEAIKAQATMSLPTTRLDMREAGADPAFGLTRFLPVYGDDVLPERPLDAVAKGAGAEVALLIGTNEEEFNTYLVPTGLRSKMGSLLSWFFLSRSMKGAWPLLKAYGLGRRPRGHAVCDALTDLVFRAPARAFARAHQGRTHVYSFDWRSPAFGGELGACHGVELPFVFDRLDTCTGTRGLLGPDPAPQALADRMHALWVGFARDGALPWPAYEAESRKVYRPWADQVVTEAPLILDQVKA